MYKINNQKLMLLICTMSLSACVLVKSADPTATPSASVLPLTLTVTVPHTWEEIGGGCLLNSGAVYCWSSGSFPSGPNQSDTQVHPTLITTLPGAPSKVVMYSNRGCGIFSGGAIRCWGMGYDPATPIIASGATDISMSYFSGTVNQTCAIVNGGAKCWGYNAEGEIGDGTTTDRITPVDVSGLTSGVSAISVGLRHSCAVKNGAAFCWGSNIAGELGDGTTTESHIPVAVSGMNSGVTAIAASYGSYGAQGDQTFAIKDGTVYGWGMNDLNQLGDGTTTERHTPVALPGLSGGFTSVDTGGAASCALKSGSLWCWGDNLSGNLATGNTNNFTTPVQVSIAEPVRQFETSGVRTCAATENKIYCWGYNGDGEITAGTSNVLSPTVIYSR
jgi:hypothetical protein